jgi:hypothetical protein
MKKIILCLFAFAITIPFLQAQKLSPDKFINKIKKEDSAYAFTLPGWLIKVGGKIAISDDEVDQEEREMIKELTGHIKKIRFVVSETLSPNFDTHFKALTNYMSSNNYEQLISVREEGNKINLWALFDGNKIERMIVSVNGPEDGSAFFNIKSDIDMDRLKKMKFFQEWSSL